MEDAFPSLPDCAPVWEAVFRWHRARGVADIRQAAHAVDAAVHSMLCSYVAADRLTRQPPPGSDAALLAWFAADVDRRTGDDLRADIRSRMECEALTEAQRTEPIAPNVTTADTETAAA